MHPDFQAVRAQDCFADRAQRRLRPRKSTYLGATSTRAHAAAPHAEARRLTDCCVACVRVSCSIWSSSTWAAARCSLGWGWGCRQPITINHHHNIPPAHRAVKPRSDAGGWPLGLGKPDCSHLADDEVVGHEIEAPRDYRHSISILPAGCWRLNPANTDRGWGRGSSGF